MSEAYVYSYGRCPAPPNWNFMKMSACNRLYLIYGGSGWYQTDGGERPFLPGRLYLFPMNAPFHVRHLEKDPLDHLYFDFSLTPPLRSAKIAVLDLTGEAASPEEAALRHLTQALELLMAQKAPADTVTATFSALLPVLCSLGGYSRSHDRRVEQALERIHRIAADERLDLPDNRELAELLHLDVNYFIRLFRREVGVTPHQYIRNHRLNVAAACIEAGSTVSEAAHLVGYENVAALSHAMKRRYDKARHP